LGAWRDGEGGSRDPRIRRPGRARGEAAAARETLHDHARKELVRPARLSSVKDETKLAFWHVLVRDVAYAQIPRAARARKHEAAARWIEQMAGGRVSDHADLLAHHYERALELAQAAEEDGNVDRLRTSARRFLSLAGERARRLDPPTAEGYFGRALSLGPEGAERAPPSCACRRRREPARIGGRGTRC
jgi:predicted ATPase